ncbi:lysylphosphatidylglycerol synthase transmembrane domain-containing protein [Bacillus sp. 03113]|uniref:lysylphosphatidylglycerol synthase transmembrane domain-containing protein n=1 Tax=Bacillus sp. 03113 TaxID=2578211 RepID=UPI0011422D27|nr:lysylphosphatidylglycerol synthase transmembrane domain-containing protein [Bacillus sp. 03113]
MNHIYKKLIKFGLSIFVLTGFVFLTIRYFNGKHLLDNVKELLQHPFILLFICTIYLLSFGLKGFAWKLYLNGRPRFSSCMLGIFYSLFINHILPVKAGDLVRIKILSTRDPHIKDEESIHSVIVLRILDMMCLMLLTLAGLVTLNVNYSIPIPLIGLVSLIFIIVIILVKKYFPAFLERQMTLLRNAFSGKNGVAIFSLIFLSWVLEASILYGTVFIVGQGDLSLLQAVFANSVTIAGQIFQVTPGGIANYESFLVFALRLCDIPVTDGYTISILTHALKFGFSYGIGAVVFMIYPIPLKTIKGWMRRVNRNEKRI